MSIDPNLVFCTRSVLRDAERMCPDTCIENAVSAAIARGAKRRRAPEGVVVDLGPDDRFVIVNPKLGALVCKRRSPLAGKPSWLVTRLLTLRTR